jgi:hypothetical protein
MEPKLTKSSSFTKSIMSIVVFLYFMGSLIGTALVVLAAIVDIKLGNTLDSAMFIAYAAYLGAPTATAIGFYAWKSKAENVLKIGKTFNEDTAVSVMDLLSRMEED